MRFVHCLARVPGAVGKLVYPHELNVSETYQGHSILALLGDDHTDLAQNYMFLAILEGKIFPVLMERQGKTMTFIAEVPRIGGFKFRAMGLVPMPLYVGRYSQPGSLLVPYYLSTADHVALDVAARERDFYFAGFSPVLEEADDYPFR